MSNKMLEAGKGHRFLFPGADHAFKSLMCPWLCLKPSNAIAGCKELSALQGGQGLNHSSLLSAVGRVEGSSRKSSERSSGLCSREDHGNPSDDTI